MQLYSEAESFRAIMAAVVDRAIDDIKGVGPRGSRKEPDRAMAFILSEDCEAYCLELNIDYETIREKAAALYSKIIAKEEKPLTARYVQRKGQLSGNRAYPSAKVLQSSVIIKGQSGARQSSYSSTPSLR